jgi:hypothetical protein
MCTVRSTRFQSDIDVCVSVALGILLSLKFRTRDNHAFAASCDRGLFDVPVTIFSDTQTGASGAGREALSLC